MENLDITGTSPLQFQDDYFANNLSTDEINDFPNIQEEEEGGDDDVVKPNSLHKTTSIMSLTDSKSRNVGIMFKELRTLPMSTISLENSSLSHTNNNIQNDDILSINPADDTESTIISPFISHHIDDECNDQRNNNTGFPFQFEENLEYSDDCEDTKKFFNHKQHFFILSSAGKPIYSMHGSYDIFVVYSGIIQTIVSFFKYSSKNEENIKLIESIDELTGKPIKFVFLDKSPIILMSIVQSNKSTQIELYQQLDFIYSFILSALSKPYIDKIFNKYANFDLRNLLGKTDVSTLDSICEDLANNLNISQIMGGLQCLRMHLSIRTRLEKKLIKFKSDNLLYGLIIGPNEKLISIMRPKRHTLHTSDLMILFEMIFNTNTFKYKNDNENKKFEENEMNIVTNETFWVPICLPKFNATGHLYNHIQFFQLNDERLLKLHDINYENSMNNNNNNNKSTDSDNTKIGIILMSPYKDSFNELRKISNEIAKTILFDGKIFTDIWNSLVGNGRVVVEKIVNNHSNDNNNNNNDINNVTTGTATDGNTFSLLINRLSLNSKLNDIPIIQSNNDNLINWNGIIHFCVKSKKSVQCIFPESNKFNIHNKEIKRNLLKVYKYLRHRLNIIWNDSLYMDSYNNETSMIENNENINIDSNTVVYEDWIDKNHYNERIVGFASKFGNFEVFIIGKGDITENEMLIQGLKIIKWVRKQESRIFISTGCIF